MSEITFCLTKQKSIKSQDRFDSIGSVRTWLKLNINTYIIIEVLTLTSLTSERACQVGGGGLRGPPPPLLSWLWSNFLLKNYVSLKGGINYNSFGPFFEFFLKNHQKNQRKLKIHQKMAKYERNF